MSNTNIIVNILFFINLEEKPTNWDSMPTDSAGKEVHVHQVTLQPSSQEYKEVEDRFNATMKKGSHYEKILSIERIQNPILYGQYVSRKREMEKRNPATCKNEQWLFHGTAPGVVNDITTQGFNRSFQGKNGKSVNVRVCVLTYCQIFLAFLL